MNNLIESHTENCLVCGYTFEEAIYLHEEDSTILQGDEPFIRKTIHKGDKVLLDLLVCPKCKYVKFIK